MSPGRRSHPVVIAERQVRLGSRDIPCTVKLSSRARRVRFEVWEDGSLTVVLPRSCGLDAVDEMVRSKSRWILRQVDRFSASMPLEGPRKLRAGDTVPYLGKALRIETPAANGGEATVQLRGETLQVCTGGTRYGLEVLVRAWYRIQAADLLRRKAEAYAADLGVTFGRCTIRSQRTRWGSCSHKGTISFNWRLMMAPEPVVDYVVVHEVSHLREMNHTGRFWRLVAERCPSWPEHRKWLHDHGAELSALLAGPLT